MPEEANRRLAILGSEQARGGKHVVRVDREDRIDGREGALASLPQGLAQIGRASCRERVFEAV